MARNLDNLGKSDQIPTVNRSAVPDMNRVQPSDWSVLGLVDGRRTLDAICQAAPMLEREALAALVKLRDMGIIILPLPSPAPSPASAVVAPVVRPMTEPTLAAVERRSSQLRPSRLRESVGMARAVAPREKPRSKKGSVRLPPPTGWPMAFERFTLPAELSALEVELEDDKRRQIAYWHMHLREVDYYQLFQVDRMADERVLRRAYFALSKEFHPDQFFRKTLGPFEDMVGEIFRWAAEAHATLSDPVKRRQYDTLLTRGLKGPWELERVMAGPRTGRPVSSGELTVRPDVTPSRGVSASGIPAVGAPTPMTLEQGRRLMDAGRWVEALKGLEGTLAQGFQPRVAVAAARCLLELGERLEVADAYCRRALKETGLTQVDKRDALIVLGGLFERVGRYEDARKLLVQAQRLDPRNASIREHLERIDQHRSS